MEQSESSTTKFTTNQDGGNIEEVIMFSDNLDEVETHWRNKWRIVDVILTIGMSVIFAIIVYRHRQEALRKLLWVFIFMLLFLIYPLVSYGIVFLVSAVIYVCLAMSGKKNQAHKLTWFYVWLRHLLEGAILMLCTIEAIRGLISSDYDNYIFHQVYFVLMIFVVLFRVVRMFWVFFRSAEGKTNSSQMIFLGGGLFKINNSDSSKKTTHVTEMMQKMGDGKMVGENDVVHVEGLDGSIMN